MQVYFYNVKKQMSQESFVSFPPPPPLLLTMMVEKGRLNFGVHFQSSSPWSADSVAFKPVAEASWEVMVEGRCSSHRGKEIKRQRPGQDVPLKDTATFFQRGLTFCFLSGDPDSITSQWWHPPAGDPQPMSLQGKGSYPNHNRCWGEPLISGLFSI